MLRGRPAPQGAVGRPHASGSDDEQHVARNAAVGQCHGNAEKADGGNSGRNCRVPVALAIVLRAE